MKNINTIDQQELNYWYDELEQIRDSVIDAVSIVSETLSVVMQQVSGVISDVVNAVSNSAEGYIRLEVYLNDYRDPENDMSILDVEVAETGNGYDDVLEYRNLNDVIAEIDVGLSRVVPEYLDGWRDKFGQSQE